MKRNREGVILKRFDGNTIVYDETSQIGVEVNDGSPSAPSIRIGDTDTGFSELNGNGSIAMSANGSTVWGYTPEHRLPFADSGLQLYVPMRTSLAFATDESGNGNDIQDVVSVTAGATIPGKNGASAALNASTDVLNFDDLASTTIPAAIGASSTMSIGGWYLFTDATTGTPEYLFDIRADANNAVLANVTSSTLTAIVVVGGTTIATLTAPVVSGVWYHVCVTVGDSSRLYINGKQADSDSSDYAAMTPAALAFGNLAAANFGMTGSLTELFLSTSEFTATQVYAIHAKRNDKCIVIEQEDPRLAVNGNVDVSIDGNPAVQIGESRKMEANTDSSIHVSAHSSTKAAQIAVSDSDDGHFVVIWSGRNGSVDPAIVWDSGQSLRLCTATDPDLSSITSRVEVTNAGQVQSGNGVVGTPAYSFLGDPDTGIYSVGANTLGFATAGAKVMELTATGALEADKLQPMDATADIAVVNDVRMGSDTNTNTYFHHRLSGSGTRGQVGMMHSFAGGASGSKVFYTIMDDAATDYLHVCTTNTDAIVPDVSTDTIYRLKNDGAIDAYGDVTVTGDVLPVADVTHDLGSASAQWNNVYVGTLVESSDEKAKEKAAGLRIDTARNIISKLKPKSYTLKAQPNRGTRYGFMAQDIEKDIPSVSISKAQKRRRVTKEIDRPGFPGEKVRVDVMEDVPDEMVYGLVYSDFIGPLVRVVQDLMTRVSSLEQG